MGPRLINLFVGTFAGLEIVADGGWGDNTEGVNCAWKIADNFLAVRGLYNTVRHFS